MCIETYLLKTYMNACMHTYMLAHVHTYMHTYTGIRIYKLTDMHACIYTTLQNYFLLQYVIPLCYIALYRYIYIYIYIHTYIHTLQTERRVCVCVMAQRRGTILTVQSNR